MKKLLTRLPILLTLIIICLGLAGSLRGRLGNINPQDLLSLDWSENGPFELSVERGRFALTYSLIENGSVSYSLPVARFATPDLGYKNGQYVSLFAPGFSFLIIPGYLVGKLLGAAQLGTYAVISTFALLNGLLIYLLSKRLGSHPIASSIAALVFIFATPAFPYAVSLYQHHVSTFLLLVSLYLLIAKSSIWSRLGFWICFGVALTVDYPNFFLFLPAMFLALSQVIKVNAHKVSLDLIKGLAGVAILIPLALMGYYNLQAYGSPFQLAGTVAAVKAIDDNGLPTLPQQDPNSSQDLEKFTKPDATGKTAVGFFKTRHLLEGLSIHLTSPDRGLLVYSPVMLLSIIGAYLVYRKQQLILPVLLGTIGANLVLYSLWGDPWGGWAFGSRYLIPTYAVCSVLLSVFLSAWRKKTLALSVFLIAFVYSAGVNSLGAITTSRNPPQVEILALEKVTNRRERFSFDRNWEFLQSDISKSFVYNTYLADYFNAATYFYIIWGGISLVALGYLVFLRLHD